MVNPGHVRGLSGDFGASPWVVLGMSGVFGAHPGVDRDSLEVFVSSPGMSLAFPGDQGDIYHKTR